MYLYGVEPVLIAEKKLGILSLFLILGWMSPRSVEGRGEEAQF
jgi:hypothetical protein